MSIHNWYNNYFCSWKNPMLYGMPIPCCWCAWQARIIEVKKAGIYPENPLGCTLRKEIDGEIREIARYCWEWRNNPTDDDFRKEATLTLAVPPHQEMQESLRSSLRAGFTLDEICETDFSADSDE